MKFAVAIILVAASMATLDARERSTKPKKTVCFYDSWAYYNSGNARVVAEDVSPNACTHMIYAFAGMKNGVMSVMDQKLDVQLKMIDRVAALRKYNPQLTVMISLGGFSDGSSKYSEMVASPAKRRLFVSSIVRFLKQHNLDGVDLDWEYPTYAAQGSNERTLGRVQDKKDYITLLKEIKHSFKQYGFVLSATVAGAKDKIDRAYDVQGINKFVDFINVMAFDYQSDNRIGHNAPLYAPSNSPQDKVSNVAFTVDYLIQKGAAPEKIVLGIPLYGKSYKLATADSKLGARASSVNDAPTFASLCKTLSEPAWKTHFDDKAKASYAVKGDQWISYDCPKVIQAKLDYVVAKKLGGSFIWALSSDDPHNVCGGFGKYPVSKMLMKTLNHVDVVDVQIPKAQI